MINGMPNPFGRELGKIARDSKRFKTSDVDSLGRIAKEGERFKQSDVDTPATDVLKGKKPRAVRDTEKTQQGG